MSSTGERQPSSEAMGEESKASLALGSVAGKSYSRAQSCTPCKSTPARTRSELRARAMAVRKPPYEPPHAAIRPGLQIARGCDDVVVFARPCTAEIQRLAEV